MNIVCLDHPHMEKNLIKVHETGHIFFIHVLTACGVTELFFFLQERSIYPGNLFPTQVFCFFLFVLLNHQQRMEVTPPQNLVNLSCNHVPEPLLER